MPVAITRMERLKGKTQLRRIDLGPLGVKFRVKRAVTNWLGCLVRQIVHSDHRQGHVDLLVEGAALYNLVLAVIWNSRQCRGADCSYVIRGQRCGVKEPLRCQRSNLRVGLFNECHAYLRTDCVVPELLTAYPIRKSHKVAETRLVTV